MVKKKRKKHRRRKRIGLVLLIFLAMIAVGGLLVWKVFTVHDVEVEGNAIYSDEKIERWVLNDEYSWNSLYVYFKYKLKDMEEIPFVDSLEVSLKSPHILSVQVYEKGILGYVYIPSLGQNAYIDKDGFVVELSTDVIEGSTKISGLPVQTAKLYEKLPLEKSGILKTLLSVTQLLTKYELLPNLIYVTDADEVLLSYGDVQVNIGGNVYLNEKIVRLQQIMPNLEGMTGTLHMENWSETNTDIIFAKGELLELPKDVQTVPVSEGEDDAQRAPDSDVDDQKGDTSDEDTSVDDADQDVKADDLDEAATGNDSSGTEDVQPDLDADQAKPDAGDE